MNRWQLLVNLMLGRDKPALHDHEERISALENKVAVIEAMAVFRHMVGEGHRP